MDFRFTDEQRQIVEMVREFVDEEVVPIADEIDHDDDFPAGWSTNSRNSD